jgi:hypothetical protein
MSTAEQNSCRMAAAECLELARLTADPQAKRALLTMAQEWIKVAYCHQVAHFEHIVDDFNARQIAGNSSAPRS